MTVDDVESSESGGKSRLEPKEITKLNFDEGCEFYSLKVPKGFDIKKLKVGLKLICAKFSNFSKKSRDTKYSKAEPNLIMVLKSIVNCSQITTC